MRVLSTLPSLNNSRDLSEYTNKNGYRFIPQKVIRSQNLDAISISDSEYLLTKPQNPLTAVIDLRNSKEIQKSTNNFFNNTNVNYYNFCLTDPEFYKKIHLYNSGEEYLTLNTRKSLEQSLDLMYKDFITNPLSVTAFKNIFSVFLKNKNGAILYHCVAGRDRTGVVTALLMHVLNFKAKDIYTDFLLTNKIRLLTLSQSIKKLKQQGKSHCYIQKYKRLQIAKLKDLKTFFKQILISYGSYENFYKKIGLTPNNILKLQKLYLQK